MQIIFKIIELLARYKQRNIERKNLDSDFNTLKNKKDIILENWRNEYRIDASIIGFTDKVLKKFKVNSGNLFGDIILGEIDQDGNLLPFAEKIDGIKTITKDQFMQRALSKIFLEIYEDNLCIEKIFSGKLAFVKEIKALHRLSNKGLRVPSIMDINFDKLSVKMTYINGITLKEALSQSGAVIKDKDIGRSVDCTIIKRKMLESRRLREANYHMNQVVNEEFLTELYEKFSEINSLGVIIRDIKYGNIIIEKEDNRPYLIDFGSSYTFDVTNNWVYKALKKAELIKIKRYFRVNLKP